MATSLPSGVVAEWGDQEFGSRSSQTNDLTIDACHLLAWHLTLIGYGNDWLAECQDNVTEGMSCHGASSLISKWGSTIKLPCVHTVTGQYPSWYDLRCCIYLKLQQQTIDQPPILVPPYLPASHTQFKIDFISYMVWQVKDPLSW